jgi:hypothetical protein
VPLLQGPQPSRVVQLLRAKRAPQRLWQDRVVLLALPALLAPTALLAQLLLRAAMWPGRQANLQPGPTLWFLVK